MSRTYKDKPSVWIARWASALAYYNTYGIWPIAVTLPKKRKRVHLPEDYGCCGSEPSWWKRMTTTKRRRRQGRIFEAVVKTIALQYLEEIDPPTNWNKPREYYW